METFSRTREKEIFPPFAFIHRPVTLSQPDYDDNADLYIEVDFMHAYNLWMGI